MRFRLAAAIAAIALAAPAIAQKAPDTPVQNRIIDQALNHSEVMQTAAHLTDSIGGRMTNSPQMREAERWTQQRFRDWGLSNVRADPFEFGRGWSIVSSSAVMTAPRRINLRAIPVAWTPPTDGTVSAQIVVAPMKEAEDFAQWRGKLSGKIVLVSHPGAGSEPERPAFRRLTSEDLAKLGDYEQPAFSETEIAKQLKQAAFEEQRDAFLKQEGALAWVRISPRDGGLLHGTGYSYQVGRTPALSGMEMAAEDYRRLARLALTATPPTLAISSDVRFHDEDTKAYNILADLPGSDPRAGYVMAGAHLDSWVAGDGAQDNAAGSAVVMEAARILATLGVHPKRTIRFALWNGEEQALLGSIAYVEKYLASRPELTDPAQAALSPYYTWRLRWPVTPKPGHRDLTAYFNIDNGSGKLRGIYAEGNVAAMPTLREWIAPFAGMGVTTVSPQPTEGTDHLFMSAVGIPAFQFIQDPLDYGSRIHHTNLDTYDHLKAEDLRQAALVLASLLLKAANADEPLPRMPVPARPAPADPFEYAKPGE
ncbi:M20/M25/M40 family metallo-hydrolase [Allosphingosinicella indica]|uniref:Carboxypeptidase Q n=1 Tax=Allosphingosinicella indica TaxID=941907 RepID=A0A1X7GRC4_9SPHN|nr:M20/M25/M40 family metallo-hydrolase [Allosphingosinicella indica]SMF72838.1 Peptidase family M28 [Allosphingosinicella indica]